VLQFCPQAPVKSIEIALALSTLATVSLTEESFTRIRELAKWRSPEDRPSRFDVNSRRANVVGRRFSLAEVLHANRKGGVFVVRVPAYCRLAISQVACARARVQAWQAHRSGDFRYVQIQFGE
jgi:hypothetical protein